MGREVHEADIAPESFLLDNDNQDSSATTTTTTLLLTTLVAVSGSFVFGSAVSLKSLIFCFCAVIVCTLVMAVSIFIVYVSIGS